MSDGDGWSQPPQHPQYPPQQPQYPPQQHQPPPYPGPSYQPQQQYPAEQHYPPQQYPAEPYPGEHYRPAQYPGQEYAPDALPYPPPGAAPGGPAPAGPPPPSGPPRDPRVAVVAGVTALAVVVVGLLGAFLLRDRIGLGGAGTAPPSARGPGASAPSQQATSAPAPSDSPAPPSTSPAASSPAASSTAPAGGGPVTIAPGVRSGTVERVTAAVSDVLGAYVAGVNGRDARAAYAAYSPAQQGREPFDTFSKGIAGSSIETFTVTALSGATSDTGKGPVQATASFTSRQPGELGPVPGQTCTRWTLVYTLVPDGAGTGYLIDGARPPSGSGHRAC